MIFQSSRDYLSGQVILHFDGDEPDRSEIIKHLRENYSFSGDPVITVDYLPNDYKGLNNPGQITVFLSF